MSAARIAALALLTLSLPAAAASGGGSKGPDMGDWVITYDYDTTSLDASSPYWEAALYPAGDLELTLLAFPVIQAYLPTSVWGTWESRRGGRELVLRPDRFTELTGWAAGGGCYAGQIVVTDSSGTRTGVWEGCPAR
jgi:hypothetical protein